MGKKKHFEVIVTKVHTFGSFVMINNFDCIKVHVHGEFPSMSFRFIPP